MFFKAFKPAVCAAAVCAVFGVCATTVSTTAAAAEPSAASVRSQLPDFASLVEKYGPGVVNISTIREARQVSSNSPFGGMDEYHAEILKRFGFPVPMIPGHPGQRSEPARRGNGSGFIISEDGIILTNHHVIDGADEITVKLTDNREFTGKVIGSDPETDVAVVKIEAKNLPVLKIGKSEDLRVGEWVAAIGSPYGFTSTITSGIVSAKSRRLPSDDYVPFIQTDVAINPGNSGGPLFNMDGEVVGINSQIFTTSGGFMGLSFAIPIDLAIQIKDQLVANGSVTRGRIGVAIQDINQELADSLGMKTPNGAIVAKIEKDGPAAQSDLAEGDVIVSVNGKKISSSTDLPVIIRSMAPGSVAKLGVLRDGKEISVNVTVAAAGEKSSNNNAKAMKLGVTVRALTDKEKKDLDLADGLFVVSCEDPAKKAGVMPGDIIVRVNNTVLSKPSDLGKIIEKTSNLRLLIQRGNGRIFLPIRLK